jgi:hypothetical protein
MSKHPEDHACLEISVSGAGVHFINCRYSVTQTDHTNTLVNIEMADAVFTDIRPPLRQVVIFELAVGPFRQEIMCEQLLLINTFYSVGRY